MIIAVNFDGTIVEDKYPEIGEPKLFAFDTLKMLQKKQHQLVLWTPRTGQKLQEAVEFCKENGVEFYAVNKSYFEEKYDKSISRKISADVFIDHRNIGGLPGWGEIFQIIENGNIFPGNEQSRKAERQGLLKRLFKKKK